MTLEHAPQASIQKVSDIAGPKEVIVQAKEWATELMQIVEERKLYQVIGQKRHIYAEGWQIVTTFDRAHAVPDRVTPMHDAAGEVNGYEAKVNLMKDGQVVGAGIMSCGFDEYPCKGKSGTAKHRAAMSAAETWATAKAARLNYSWVVELAGFSPTPAEEMRDERGETEQGQAAPSQQQNGQHAWMVQCPEHKVNWFKTANMPSHAHKPTEDGGKWCNRDPMISALAMEQINEGADALDWDGERLAGWLKKPWQDLAPEQHIKAMEAMAEMVMAAALKPDVLYEDSESAAPAPQSDEPEASAPETQEDEVQALFGAPQDEA